MQTKYSCGVTSSTEILKVTFTKTAAELKVHANNLPLVDCGPPVNPLNGSAANYTSTTNGSVAFFSCSPGLVPEGRMRAECTGNGWNPNPADLSCTIGMF